MLRCWGTLRHEGYLIRVTLAMTYRVAFCLRFSALTRETTGQRGYTGSVGGKFDHKPGKRQEPVSVILWPTYSDLFQRAVGRPEEDRAEPSHSSFYLRRKMRYGSRAHFRLVCDERYRSEDEGSWSRKGVLQVRDPHTLAVDHDFTLQHIQQEGL